MKKKSLSNYSPVRKARRHHKYLRAKDPSIARAVPGAGMVLPTGEVALPLTDGDIAVYGVASTTTYRCQLVWLANSGLIEAVLNRVVDFDRHVRAAQPKTNLVRLDIAAE